MSTGRASGSTRSAGGPPARSINELAKDGGRAARASARSLSGGAFGAGAVAVAILAIVEGDALGEGVAMNAEDDCCV